MEKTIFPLHRLKFILNSIKKQWNRSVKSLQREAGSTLLRTIFELFFQEFCNDTIGLFKRGGKVPKSFFFEKPDETMSFFWSAFQSTLLKCASEVFFCFGQCRLFLIHKCLGTLLRKSFAHKNFIQKANNASWLISHFDVVCCYSLYGLSAFSNQHAVLRKF